MGKKSRMKNKNQEKEHYRDYNRRNIATKEIMYLDRIDFVNSSWYYFLCRIIPFLLHQRKHQEKEAENLDPNGFISRLPVDILCHIISFLPFELAVQTTCLSTRWKGLWQKALMGLVQDATLEDAAITISNFLDGFSELHRPRNNWGFQFDFGQARVLSVRPGLLSVAIAPNNTLHIDFSAGEQEFPWPFDWFLGLYLSLPTHQPSSYALKIKALDLRSLSHLSSKAISSMVSNFPFLQSLTIAKCNDLQSLHVEGARNLQKLTVFDCLRLKSLHVENSHLRSFKCRGKLVSFLFAPLHWCYLEDAMLDFRQGPGHNCNYNSLGLRSIFQTIEGVKSLTLCRWIFQELIYGKLAYLGFEFRFYKLKELWWIDHSAERNNVNGLLCFLKLCPNLERLYVTIDPKCYNDVTSTKKFSPVLTGIKKVNDLKVVKLDGFADSNKVIFFAKRLRPLIKARTLIISKSDGTWLRRLVKVLSLEEKGKYSYRFEFIKDVHDEICPDHVHMNL